MARQKLQDFKSDRNEILQFFQSVILNTYYCCGNP